MRIRLTFALIFTAFSLLAAPAPADDTPATQPATQPYIPYKTVVPPGYHIVPLGDRKIICLPADDAWVGQTIIQPATRPTTMPSDILAGVMQKRAELTRLMLADLALTDPKPLNEVVDRNLIPEVTKLADLKPTIYFLPITQKDLARLVENGWTDPRFHYIRYARQVVYDDRVALATDHPMDDMIIWVELQDDEKSADKTASLAFAISKFESDFQSALSLFSESGVRNVLADFILTKVSQPLKLAPTEAWFNISIAEVYGIKYATFITGSSRASLMRALLLGDPRNPLDWQPLDLVNPLDPSSMRPEYRRVYDNAVVRKGSFVIQSLITKGGDNVLSKILPAIRTTPPANAQDLIKIIITTTGIDPTPVMEPFYSLTPPEL